MEKIKVITNKKYIVVECINNVLIAVTDTEEEAKSICSTNEDYSYYKIGKHITFEYVNMNNDY